MDEEFETRSAVLDLSNRPQVSMGYKLNVFYEQVVKASLEFFGCSTNIPRGLSVYNP